MARPATTQAVLGEKQRPVLAPKRAQTAVPMVSRDEEGAALPLRVSRPSLVRSSRATILRSTALWSPRGLKSERELPSGTSSLFSSESSFGRATNSRGPSSAAQSPLALPVPLATGSSLQNSFFPLTERYDTPAYPVWEAPAPAQGPYARRPGLRRTGQSSDVALSALYPPTPAESAAPMFNRAASFAGAAQTPRASMECHGVIGLDAEAMGDEPNDAPRFFETPWPTQLVHPTLWRHWPALLFAANVAGLYMAGLGAIWLERGIYATRPLKSPPSGPVPPGGFADRPRPDLLGAWQTPARAIAAGSVASAAGLTTSLISTWRICLDGRALASRRLRDDPRALWRPNLFGSVNALNQFLWWAYRFRAEATRDHGDIHDTWLNGAMGAVGAAAFAGVQSIALSSSELLRVETLPQWRQTLSRVAMAMVGVSYPLYAHYIAEPHSSAELRSSLRIMASASLTVANTVVMTHMRRLTPQQIRNADQGVFARDRTLAAPDKRLGVIPQHFYPLALLSLHGMGRLLIHVFSVPWAQLYRKQAQSAPPNTELSMDLAAFDPAGAPHSPAAPSAGGPPAPNGSHAFPPVSERLIAVGIAFVALGWAVGLGVTYALTQDARKVRRRDWPLLSGAAVLATLCIGAHRVINESDRDNSVEKYELTSVLLGCTGYATELVSIVSLFAYSQMRNGRPAWPWADHALQLTRATGDATLHMWAIMAGFPFFNPTARALTFTAGTFLTQLGLAIPTGVVGHAQTKQVLEQEEQRLELQQAGAL